MLYEALSSPLLAVQALYAYYFNNLARYSKNHLEGLASSSEHEYGRSNLLEGERSREKE